MDRCAARLARFVIKVRCTSACIGSELASMVARVIGRFVVVLRCTVIVCSVLSISCDSWRTYRVSLNTGEQLSEDLAIRLSAEVIRQAGYDPSRFELFPIRAGDSNENRYFGTGPAQPPHGYVMWRHKDPSRGKRGLTVSIEMDERVAVCRLSWWH